MQLSKADISAVREDGSLQEILPPYWTFNSKDFLWPSVATIIPDWYYDFYGDDRLIRDNYQMMKRFVLYHERANLRADGTLDFCTYGDWTLAGINYDPKRPGFKHVILRPALVGDLSFVTASHTCPYDVIRSAWRIADATCHWQFSVPPNTVATVYVPTTDNASIQEHGSTVNESPHIRPLRIEERSVVYEVDPGLYEFQSAWRQAR